LRRCNAAGVASKWQKAVSYAPYPWKKRLDTKLPFNAVRHRRFPGWENLPFFAKLFFVKMDVPR
jgi:hypothetical protein